MDDMLKGKKILIVDDESDVLESIIDILDQCEVESAASFEAAMDCLNKTRYDAAILDIMGVDGYKLLAAANRNHIPVIMLTAHALSAGDLVKSLKKGAFAYVPKDKMAQIEIHLVEMLKEIPKKRRSGKWFRRLKPYFDQKFGTDWQEVDKAFWDEYQKAYTINRHDMQSILKI